MKIKENINGNIFRGYDIRGIYPTELDEDTLNTIIQENDGITCVCFMGGDKSPEFIITLAKHKK